MADEGAQGIDIGPCPICDQRVSLVMTDPSTEAAQAPELGTPTWYLLVHIGRHYLLQRVLRWVSTISPQDRLRVIDAVTSDEAWAEDGSDSDQALADALIVAAHRATARAENKRIRAMAAEQDRE